jgi:hypothetical protein
MWAKVATAVSSESCITDITASMGGNHRRPDNRTWSFRHRFKAITGRKEAVRNLDDALRWEAILLKSNGLHIRPVWANATLTLSLAKI